MFKDIKCPSCNSESLTFVNINEIDRRVRLICEECNIFCTAYFKFTTIPKPAIDMNDLKRRERLNQRITDISNVLNDLIQVEK